MYYISQNITNFLPQNDLVSFSITDKSNHKQIIPELIARVPKTITCFEHYIKKGYLHLLHEIPEFNLRETTTLIVCAIKHNHIEVIELLKDRIPSWPYYPKRDLSWYPGTSGEFTTIAAEVGSMNVLEWLRKQNPPAPWDGDAYWYVFHNIPYRETEENVDRRIEMLDLLKTLQAPDRRDPSCFRDATRCEYGYKYVKWMRENGYEWPRNVDICKNVIDHDLDGINFLKEIRGMEPPAPWSTETCRTAAKTNNLKKLKWLRAQTPPCPWDKTLLEDLVLGMGDRIEIMEWILKNGIEEIDGYEEYIGEFERQIGGCNCMFPSFNQHLDDDFEMPERDL